MKVAELKKTIDGYRTEQLRRLLVEMYKAMPKRLKEDHLEAIVAFLDTRDLKEIAIATCDEMWSRASTDNGSARSASKSWDGRSIEYERHEFLQNLARLGFLCHMALCEYDEAVDYFHKHFVKKEPEIALYVLLNPD